MYPTEDCAFARPEKVATTGIYHPRAPQPFTDIAAYRAWYADHAAADRPGIGLLFYFTQNKKGTDLFRRSINKSVPFS
jgi:cobalamin biosynthesis Mg chelatase CobN